MKKTLPYFIIYTVVLIVNILIVLSQMDNADISRFSLPALFLMLIMIIHAILSYLLRHKGNYLPFRRFAHPNPFAADKDYTYKNEYLSRFFFMLKVYCLVIPFYIPQLFFTSSYIQTLWALVPFFLPQIAYVVIGIRDTLSDVKKDKAKKEQLEKERLEQERREQLGLRK